MRFAPRRTDETSWLVAVALGTVLSVGVVFFSLLAGFHVFTSHLLYIPVILAAYRFTRRGIVFAAFLAVLYWAMVLFMTQPDDLLLLVALGRGGMFILIAAVVAALSERLNVSEARYRGVFDVAETGMCIIRERDLVIVEANRRCADIIGYPFGTAEGTPVSELWTNDGDRERFFSLLREKGRIAGYETPFRRRDGSEGWLLLSAGMLDPATYICAVTDITAQKRSGEEIAASEQRYRETLDSMQDAIHVIDRDLRILLFNKKFYTWCHDLDLSLPDSVIGLKYMDVFSFLPESVENEYRQVFSTGTSVTTEEETTVDSRRIVTLTTKIPIIRNNTVGRVVTVVRDITGIKEAEEAVRTSQRTLSTLISNLPGMAYRCANSRDWTMEFISEGVERLTGYTAADLVDDRTLSFNDIIHPDDRDYVWSTIQEAIGNRMPFQLEYRIRHRNGSVRWMWEQGRGIYSPDGGIEALEGFIADISDRKAAEEALWESEEKYRDLVEHANSVILKADTAGTILFYNEYAEALFGFPRETVLGRDPVGLFLPPVDSSGRDLRGMLEAVCSDPDSYPVNETEARTNDGRILWIQWTNRGIYNDAGRLTGVLTVGVDITERRLAEKALSESNIRLRSLLDAIPDAVYFKDTEGRHILVNHAFERLVSLPLHEISGKTNRELLPAELAAQCDASDRETVLSKEQVTTEEHIQGPSGRLVYYETIKVPLLDEEGKVANIVSVSRDITDRKEAEEAIRESEERYRAVVEDQTELISRFLPDGTHVFVNDAYCRYFGKKRGDILGTQFRADITKEDARRIGDLLASLSPDSPVGRIEHRIIMEDGSVRWQQWIDRAIYDADGNLLEYQSVGRDITDTKKAEEARRHSENLYRTVFETTGNATMIVNDDGTIWRANSEFASIFGFFSEDLEGKSAWDIFAVEERPRVKANHRLRRSGGDQPPRSYETRLIDRQGMPREVVLTVDMIPQTQQSVISLLDVTAKKQAERLVMVANAINQLIVHERDVETLLIHACELFGRLDRYFVVSIALVEDGILRPVAISDDTFADLHATDANSPLFLEVAESGSVMFETFSADEGRGAFNAVLLVPMKVEGEVKGVLGFYLYPQAMMRSQEIDSMRTLADDLAFAIKAIEIENQKRLALEQIERNIEQMAVLNDQIRNPLQTIVGLADLQGGSIAEKVYEQAQEIDAIIRRLDIGWVESTKIREFLVKHYGIKKYR
ncbi:MAG: PAS domain S-box protein [Methanomicrobiales archaeon]|nr:PAS domain S-box protein [Methanomicrobiales archaeon]